MGIDPVVVMRDIAGASREEALDAMEWSARDAGLCGIERRMPHRPLKRNPCGAVRQAGF